MTAVITIGIDPTIELGPITLAWQEIFELTLTAALGGVTTCALIYLLTERLLRPVTGLALASGPVDRPCGPGVRTRLITAWALASGVPLLGLGLLALRALGGEFDDAHSLAIALLVLTGAGLGAGAIAMVLSARSLAEPIDAVREALARIRVGDLDVQVAVDDGSELGLPQAGFTETAAGLRERERLRDLFGRRRGPQGGRRRRRARRRRSRGGRSVHRLGGIDGPRVARLPEEVVSLLNRFFAVVVDVVAAFGGWVNRFEGDGALCVFGAPTAPPDAAGSALAAGRMLRDRVAHELPEIEVGIGISAGPAVAGNVGAERLLEYTVIGDAINEAARLCVLAKRRPDQVLASGAALARASADERHAGALGRRSCSAGGPSPRDLRPPPRRQRGRQAYRWQPRHNATPHEFKTRAGAAVERRQRVGAHQSSFPASVRKTTDAQHHGW